MIQSVELFLCNQRNYQKWGMENVLEDCKLIVFLIKSFMYPVFERSMDLFNNKTNNNDKLFGLVLSHRILFSVSK